MTDKLFTEQFFIGFIIGGMLGTLIMALLHSMGI